MKKRKNMNSKAVHYLEWHCARVHNMDAYVFQVHVVDFFVHCSFLPEQ